MQIAGFEFPDELYYDNEHGWARVEGDIVTQGLTQYGQHIAKEIVYAEVPRVGRAVERKQPFMSMESGKWVGRVKAIVAGVITEANEELEWQSSLINEAPYGGGWLVKIKTAGPDALAGLWRPSDPDFQAYLKAEMEKYG